MRNKRHFVLIVLGWALAAGIARSQDGGPGCGMRCRMMAPLPQVMISESNPLTEEKVDLGRMLYYEPRLSRSQSVSCNSCHPLSNYGADGKPVSPGHKGLTGSRNSPSVYNAAGHMAQFWDGRAADVEEQAKGPVTNPVEMAMPSEHSIIAVLQSMPEYVAAFHRAFPMEKDPVTFDNMAKAIGAFERRLVTPSRWDTYLRGDDRALSAEEQAGWREFMHTGCQTCHNGPYVGGSMHQKLGVQKPWPDASDLGRFQVTRLPADRMVFKVASLRNVEKTGPYFHNGKVASLEEAVRLMAEHQLGARLSEPQARSIAAWLKSLTGRIPAEYVRPPALPPSTARTPKPDISD